MVSDGVNCSFQSDAFFYVRSPPPEIIFSLLTDY